VTIRRTIGFVGLGTMAGDGERLVASGYEVPAGPTTFPLALPHSLGPIQTGHVGSNFRGSDGGGDFIRDMSHRPTRVH